MIAVAKRLINREEYYKMAEVGILKPEDRVELINGEIIEMSPIGSRHAAAVRRMARVLSKYLNEKVAISIQSPVVLNDLTEPEPDIAIVEFREDDYAAAHPDAGDVKLVIEVSDSTLDYDLTTKSNLYAAAGIAVYWVVNIDNNIIQRFSKPANGRYEEIDNYTADDEIDFLGVHIDVSSLLIP